MTLSIADDIDRALAEATPLLNATRGSGALTGCFRAAQGFRRVVAPIAAMQDAAIPQLACRADPTTPMRAPTELWAARRVLGLIATPAAVDVLMPDLRSTDPDPRRAISAEESLRHYGCSAALAPMLSSLFHGEADPRLRAFWLRIALHAPLPESFTLAEEALHDAKDAKLREEAVLGLAPHDGPRVLELLELAASDRHAAVKLEAAAALVARGRREHVPAILAAATARATATRSRAAVVLGGVGLPEVVDAVCALLADPSPSVRVEAIQATWLLGAPAAVAAVGPLHADRSLLVREHAESYTPWLIGPPPHDAEGLRRAAARMDPERRYHRGRPWTPGALVDEIPLLGVPITDQLQCATSVNLGVDRWRDLVANVEPIERWHAWWHEHEGEFEPGAWVYQGAAA